MNEKPNFSICFIGRNESSTLGKALKSLEEFKARGGEVCLVDTGSKDNTAEIAKNWGCVVAEVGDKFRTTITKEQADGVNKTFLVEGEELIIKEGDSFFDFASARNHCADTLATNDIVAFLDCDEAITAMNIDEINKAIDEGVGQFEYEFVFSHDHKNNPLLQFVQSKFYNKKKLCWKGLIHEVLQPIKEGEEIKRKYLPENVWKNEHWQNQETARGGYLKGLALDCYLHPEKDRNSHYFARELLWNGRYKSAIKEFKRYLNISWWKPERSESMVYIGDALLKLGKETEAVEWYHKAFQEEAGRREPLIKLAEFYNSKKDMQRVICYCKAALEISWSGYYSNNKYHYGHIPHEMLAEAYWCFGKKEEARLHIEKALDFMPFNGKLLFDYRFHYDLPKISFIIPTLGRPEGLKRCLDSIKMLNYPQHLIETIVIEDSPRMGVPKRLKEGLEKSTGEYVIYGSNDCEFTSDSLIIAYREMKKKNLLLLSFNTGVVSSDLGNVNEHFMIRRDYSVAADGLNGEIFDIRYRHLGCDNKLYAVVNKTGRFFRSEDAIVNHYHWSKTASREMDDVYKLGWNDEDAKHDRALLAEDLKKLDKLT